MPAQAANAVQRVDRASVPNDAVSVGVASVEVVSANEKRVEVTICNDHATQILYLSLGGTAVANEGIRIHAPGGSYTTRSYTGAINAIASGAATVATFAEIAE